MKRSLLILGISGLIVLQGCSTIPHVRSVMASSGLSSTEKKQTNYYSMGLGLASSSSVNNLGITFHPNSQELVADMTIGNGRPLPNDFALIYVLDYKQINVMYDGRSRSVLTFHLGANETKKFSITVPNLTSGTHSLLAILTRKYDQHNTNNKLTFAENVFLCKRIVIDVGHGSGKSHHQSLTVINNTNDNGTSYIGVPFISTSPMANINKAVSLTSTGKLYYNYKPDSQSASQVKNYALLCFLDNREIGLTKFFSLTSTGQFSIPLDIPIPEDGQKHELATVMVKNPFENIDQGGKIAQGIKWSWVPQMTNKITLDMSTNETKK